MNQERAGESTSPTIETNLQALTAEYNRVMPDWTIRIGGGVALIDPAGKAFPTAVIRFVMNPERATTFQLDLSRQAAPSFFVVAGALISNVGRAQVVHRLTERFKLQASASYAFNQSIPEGLAEFNNLTLSTGLSYNLTREMALEFLYMYNDYKTETTTVDYQIFRNMWGLSLTAQWQ